VVLVALLAAGCGSGTGSGPSSGAPASSASGSSGNGAASSGTGAGSPVKVSDAVLKAGDAPVGTTFVDNASGPRTLADLVKGDEQAAHEIALLKQAGFRGARQAIFTGLQLPASVKQGHLVASFAVVFGNARSAAKGMSVLGKSATAAGQSPTPVSTVGLGSHAEGLHVSLTTFPGDSYVFVWQQNNTVRVLIDAGGNGVVTQPAALRLARHMAGVQRHGDSSAGDAAHLVLQRADAPADTNLVRVRSGSRTAAQFTTAKADAARLQRLGFLAGYTNQYLSSGLAHPTTSGNDKRQSNYISSQAQQYADGVSAQRAYQLFRDREAALFNGKATSVSTDGLGKNATGFLYVDHKPSGDLNGYAYFWRSGSLVLSLFDVGTADFATEKVAHGLALTMAKRAGG
jgi:hypothetical protein